MYAHVCMCAYVYSAICLCQCEFCESLYSSSNQPRNNNAVPAEAGIK